jgi:hypothetical protein
VGASHGNLPQVTPKEKYGGVPGVTCGRFPHPCSGKCGVMFLSVCRWLHLLFNLLVQVLVGLPLEMVHGSLRIGVVYMAGVLAGEPPIAS